MKSLLINIVVVCGVLFTLSVTGGKAQSFPKFLHNVHEENGQVMSKQVFKWDAFANAHKPYRMREYTYTDDGFVKAHKTLCWNEKKNSWENFTLITYEYDRVLSTVTIRYSLWDKKQGSFGVPKRQAVYRLSEDNVATYVE